MWRRWADRGASRGGPEGRRPGTPPQRQQSGTAIRVSNQRTAAAISTPRPSTRGYGAHRGVPGTALCLRCPAGCPPRSAQCRCRAPPAGHRPGASLHATRQAAGAPSARSQPHPVTSARPRRWGDAGTPPNRRRIRRPAPWDAIQRGPKPTSPHAPLPRGHATPPAARLMGRRDARPHNADQKAGAPGHLLSGSNQGQRSAAANSGGGSKHPTARRSPAAACCEPHRPHPRSRDCR